jgi:hypothetical protein
MVDEVSDTGEMIGIIDKMDGFKRFMLVLPIEFAFIIMVLVLAWQGSIVEALAATTGLLGTMIGYYFGKSAAVEGLPK